MALSGDGTDGRELRIHDNVDELSCDLAEYIAELSENSIKERGFFAIALSGGSLISLMKKLCEAPYNNKVEWAKWLVFYADERAVAKTHADSNYKQTKEGFWSKVPILHNRVHSINDRVIVEIAAYDYEYVIRLLVTSRAISVSEINGYPKFDLILLGMGPDGHIASLFPSHPVLNEKEQWVAYMRDSPKPPRHRITFTLPIINSAANVVLVVTGSEKAEAVHLAIDDIRPDGPELPVRMVQPEGKLVWFLDMAAASKLDGYIF